MHCHKQVKWLKLTCHQRMKTWILNIDDFDDITNIAEDEIKDKSFR